MSRPAPFRYSPGAWLLAGLFLAFATGHAATLYWSGDGVNNGGTGTWDTTSSTNWGASGGPYSQTWNNTKLDSAYFQNTYEGGWFGYTVTLGANVTAGKLTAVNSGSTTTTIAPDVGGLYKITLDATGGATTIDDSDDPLIINAPIELTGSAQQFRGNVTVNGVISGNQALSYFTSNATALTLSGDNTFTGGFGLFNNDKVVLGHDNALGTGDFTVDNFGGTYYLAATNGDRTIANNFAGQNWHQTYVFQGTDDLTFTGFFEAKAYSAGSSAAVNVQDAGTVVTFDDFNTSASGSNTGDGFKKQGSGTMVVETAFTVFSGSALPFAVEAGSLLINTAATTGAVSVASAATLGGTGTITAPTVTVAANGAIAPGASVGTLGVTGNVDIDGDLTIEIGPGGADKLAITGDLDLSTAGNSITVSELPSALKGVHDLVTYTGSRTGTFAIPTLPAGWKLDYTVANTIRILPPGGTVVRIR